MAGKQLLITTLFLCWFSLLMGQNEEITIKPRGEKQFSVSSIKGTPFTVILENSEKDGNYQLQSETDLYFKTKYINSKSTLKIVFEERMYLIVQNNLIRQYQSDVKWIKVMLEITKSEFKLFPEMPFFGKFEDSKQKARLQKYITNEKKKAYYEKYQEKLDYTVKTMTYFQDLYDASNGKDNNSRHNFLPINILDHLAKKNN